MYLNYWLKYLMYSILNYTFCTHLYFIFIVLFSFQLLLPELLWFVSTFFDFITVIKACVPWEGLTIPVSLMCEWLDRRVLLSPDFPLWSHSVLSLTHPRLSFKAMGWAGMEMDLILLETLLSVCLCTVPSVTYSSVPFLCKICIIIYKAFKIKIKLTNVKLLCLYPLRCQSNQLSEVLSNLS